MYWHKSQVMYVPVFIKLSQYVHVTSPLLYQVFISIFQYQ